MAMAPPAALVRGVRHFWHCQWRQLMAGLGPADAQGRYVRPAPVFATLPPQSAEAGRPGGHVLIVGRSCPWAHRAWITWTLRGLQPWVDLQLVEPDPQAGRWRFPQPFEGCATLLDLYRRSGAPAGTRATVPALYGRSGQTIVLSESARLIELLNGWPQASGPDLAPETHRFAIDAWRQRLQGEVNDGVYRCGFARTQAAYDEAEAALFECLEEADRSLAVAEANPPPGLEEGGGPWLAGTAKPSLADVVLFPTLIRLEMVYSPLFGCSRRTLWQLPALWRWRSRFYGLPGVAATCASEHWRRDYFGSLFPLHPSGIVPAGPDLSTLVQAQPPALP